jgi:hypothetical protein
MYIGLYVKCPLFFQILMKLEFSQQIFEKYLNIKFHENLFSGSRVVPCGRTNRRTDMAKLIGAFYNFANAPKNGDKFIAYRPFSRRYYTTEHI